MDPSPPSPSDTASDSSPDLAPLVTVTHRADLLAALEAAPLGKDQLTARLDCSRSTVDRGVRELEAHSMVRRRDQQVALTAAGELALEEYRRSQSVLRSLDAAGSLLTFVSASAPLSPALFQGATIHEPDPHAPNRPIERIAHLFREAHRVRGLVAEERIPTFRRVLTERTVAGDLEAELVFTDELLAYVIEAYGETLQRVLSTGAFEGYAADEIPYGMALLETSRASYTFVVVTHGDEVRGVIENDTRAAYEWASGVFRRYRAQATRLQPPE